MSQRSCALSHVSAHTQRARGCLSLLARHPWPADPWPYRYSQPTRGCTDCLPRPWPTPWFCTPRAIRSRSRSRWRSCLGFPSNPDSDETRNCLPRAAPRVPRFIRIRGAARARPGRGPGACCSNRGALTSGAPATQTTRRKDTSTAKLPLTHARPHRHHKSASASSPSSTTTALPAALPGAAAAGGPRRPRHRHHVIIPTTIPIPIPII